MRRYRAAHCPAISVSELYQPHDSPAMRRARNTSATTPKPMFAPTSMTARQTLAHRRTELDGPTFEGHRTALQVIERQRVEVVTFQRSGGFDDAVLRIR